MQEAPAARALREARKGAEGSALEALLCQQLDALGLVGYERQYKVPGPARNWAFDLAYPAHRVLVEVDGAVYARGRHTRGAGYENDREKDNTAQLWGWRVYRFSGGQVQSGQAAATIQAALDLAHGMPVVDYLSRKEGTPLCEAVLRGTVTWYNGTRRTRRGGTRTRRT